MPTIVTRAGAVIVSGSKLRHEFGKTRQNDAATLLACEEALREDWPDAVGEVARTALVLAKQHGRAPVAKAVTALGIGYCLEREQRLPRGLAEAALLLLRAKHLRGRRSRADERAAVLDHRRALPNAAQREIARLVGIPESTMRSWLKDPEFRDQYKEAGAHR